MLANMEAQSGLGCAGQKHWRLSRAGRELWQWQPAVTTAAAVTGIQGCAGTAEAGRGNEKCEC